VKTWSVVGVPNFTNGAVNKPSLAIAENGTPFVGFVDWYGSRPSVMYPIGNTWVYLGLQGFTGNSIWDPSIAIDPGSQIYVSFRDDMFTQRVSVYKYASTWIPVGGTGGFSPDAGMMTCLAIDPNDYNPFLVYQNTSSSATAMKFDGSSWNLVGGAGFSPGAVGYLSLAIDASGTPYVGFRNEATPEFAATVMKFNGSAWIPVGAPDFSIHFANYTSLAIDSSGTPFIAYQDNVYVAKVMRYDGVNWADWGNAPATSGGDVDRVSLAISKAPGSKDSLYLAYTRTISTVPTTIYGVSVMKFNGSGWDIAGGPNIYTNSSPPDFLQIAVAPNDGTPYISIQCNGVTTVMAYK
jgi:hypothetical protein